jgi:hypothetical protein
LAGGSCAEADVLAGLDALFEARVPYRAGWFPVSRRADPADHHLRIEIVSPQSDVGKLKYLAGRVPHGCGRW